jgi:hypothetical protein
MQFSYKRTVLIISSLFLLSFVIFFTIFINLNNREANTGEQTDELSGLTFNKTAVNSDRGTNPNAPYFVGFNTLTKYGVSADEVAYIKDVIVNDTLYRKKLVYSKISYVNDSYVPPIITDLKTTYNFKYGIDDGDVHQVFVVTNLEDSSIEITIVENKTTVLKKSFIMYS